MVGLEIEFQADLRNIFDTFKSIPFLFVNEIHNKEDYLDKVVFKPEPTVNGYELNICSNNVYLRQVLDGLKRIATITDKCALHIHIPIQDINYSLIDIYNKYAELEDTIIKEAQDNNMYLDLNESITSKSNTRKKNLNLLSLKHHHTIEHRIYKATFDLNKIKYAINQTTSILK